MQGLSMTDNELQLLTESRQKYQGTAKIDINQITDVESPIQNLDNQNVQRLCEIFEKEGCRRLAIQNHISAVVSRQNLQEALRAAGIGAAEMMAGANCYPHLHFSKGQINCLHGHHRLKAGEEYLPPYDQWWTVDLYLDDISSNLQNTLIEEYSNEGTPSDGEIYQKLRQYRQEANAHFENRWWARLSDNKARRLRGLESHPNIRSAFDSLLAVPALVIQGMQIGSLAELLALNCDEEVVHALNDVREYWASIVKYDPSKMHKIDVYTVESLQLLAPSGSSKDRSKVKGLVHSGEVFANFTSSERSSIWKKLKKKNGIIPSLHTFFKNAWYLQSCARCLKYLFSPSKDLPTLRCAVRSAFVPLKKKDSTSRFAIQTSEDLFREYSCSEADPVEIGYRQLWLYAMRYYPNLSKQSPEKRAFADSGYRNVDPMILYNMAVLARRLGFKTSQIDEIIQNSPGRQIARDALLRARQADRFRYKESQLELLVDQITECFSRAIPLADCLEIKSASGKEMKKQSRYGHPDNETQRQDRYFLFLDHLHGPEPSSKKVTSIYVRWSVYFTFFDEITVPPPSSNTTNNARSHEETQIPFSPIFVPLSSTNENGHSESIALTDQHTQAEGMNSIFQEPKGERNSQKCKHKLPDSELSWSDKDSQETISGNKRTTPLCVSSKDIFDEDSIASLDMEDRERTESGPLESDHSMGVESSASVDISGGEEMEIFEQESPLAGTDSDGRGSPIENPNEGFVGTDSLPNEEWKKNSSEERENALRKLEGRRSSTAQIRRTEIQQRESRWKPYNHTWRRPQNKLSALPSQKVLVEDIEEMLHSNTQDISNQSAKHVTQIEFRDAHGFPSYTDETQELQPVLLTSVIAESSGIPDAAEAVSLRSNSPISQGQCRTAESHSAVLNSNHSNVEEGFTEAENEKRRDSYLAKKTECTKTVALVHEQQALSPGIHSIANRAAEDKPKAKTNDHSSESPNSSLVTISFLGQDSKGEWSRVIHKMDVDPSDPSPIQRMAEKNVRERNAAFYDQNLRQVHPIGCFQAALESGANNTLFVKFGTPLVVSEETMNSVTRALQNGSNRHTKRRK